MQWNIVLFVIKVYRVDRLPYALHRIWHQYHIDIMTRLDNDWNCFS